MLATSDATSWLSDTMRAAIVGGLIAISIPLIAFLWHVTHKRRAKRIVVSELQRLSLVRVRDDVRVEMQVTFAGKPALNLGQIDVAITNDGSESISKVAIVGAFLPPTRVLKVSELPRDKEDSSDTTGDEKVYLDWTDSRVFLRTDNLKTFKDHKRRIRLSIVVDGEAQRMRMTGGGPDWSVDPEVSLASSAQLKTLVNTLFVSALLIVIGAIYPSWFPSYFASVKMSDVTWASFFLTVPRISLWFFATRIATDEIATFSRAFRSTR